MDKEKEAQATLGLEILADLDQAIVYQNAAMSRYECGCCHVRKSFRRELDHSHEEWCVVRKIARLKKMLGKEEE